MIHTRLCIVMNLETLETLKHEEGKVATFYSRDHANEFASQNLNMWQVVEHDFWHPHLGHEPNTFMEHWNY